MDYADLDQLIEEFKTCELPLFVNGMVQEVKEIIESRNWDEIQHFVFIQGRRNLSNKKIEQMIHLFKERVKHSDGHAFQR